MNYTEEYTAYWSRPDRWGSHSFSDPEPIVESILDLCGGGKVLDVGCGMGLLVHRLNARGLEAHGLDVAPQVIAAANAKLSGHFHQGSILQLPFADESFHTVVSTDCLEHLAEADVPQALRELHRVAGRYVFIRVATTPDRDRRWHLTLHDRAWWEQRFLETGFRKHPRLQAIVSYESLEQEASSITLVFEKIPTAAQAQFPLARLQTERDLHMDMLRETGRRADAHVARYQWAAHYLSPNAVVLDAACGLGYGAALLADTEPTARVIGLDSSAYAIDYARANFVPHRSNLEFAEADVCQLGRFADASVDLVVSFETIEHLADPDRFCREVQRVLKPGGRLLCSVPNCWVDETGRDPNPWHLHVFDFAKLAALCQRCFFLQEAWCQNAGGGMKHPNAPRRLRRVNLPVICHEDEAEWWLVVAQKNPYAAAADLGSGGPDRVTNSESSRGDGQSACRPVGASMARSTIVALAPDTRHPLYQSWIPHCRWPVVEVNRYDASWSPPPDTALVVTHDTYTEPGRTLVQRAVAMGIPTLILADGILEYRNTFEHPQLVAGAILQPVLGHKIACLGRSQARVLESWGNIGKCEIVGAPRFDRYFGLKRRTRAPGEPFRLLIMTALTPFFTEAHRLLVTESLRDLKRFLETQPRLAGERIEPVWRLTKSLDRDLEVASVVTDLSGRELAEVLQQVDAVVSTPSTSMLEAMLLGLPVAVLDYPNSPHYVQPAWRITASCHLPEVLRELIHPPEPKLLFQDTTLHDALECASPATPRLLRLLEEMIKLGQRRQHGRGHLALPARMLDWSALAHQPVEDRFRLETLYGNAGADSPPSVHPSSTTAAPPAKPQKRRYLLFVSHDASRTGAPIFLLNFARWVRRHTDWMCRFILRAGGPLEPAFRELGQTVVSVTPAEAAWLLEDCALVYSNTATNERLLAGLPLGDIPVVTHVHELPPSIAHYSADGLAEVKRHTRLFIACSEAVARGLREAYAVPAERVRLCYESIPVGTVLERAGQLSPATVRQRLGAEAGTFLVAACGTANQRKGADLFLQAARSFADQVEQSAQFLFLWIGEVPRDEFGQRLLAAAHQPELAGRVRFLGEVENPFPWLNGCDVFCLPSREDPFPLVMLEAAALGKPVVCFGDGGGAPEFCERGAGFVVPSQDPRLLAECLNQLRRQPEMRQRAGEAARRLAQAEFDLETCASRLWEVVQQVVAGDPASPAAVSTPSPTPANTEQVACPFCGSRAAEPFRHSADIVQCAGCDTVYLRTRMTQTAMEALYQSYADEGSHLAIPTCDDQAATSPLRRDYFLCEMLQLGWPAPSRDTQGRQDTETLASASTAGASSASAPPPRRGKLLDVGCGWGAFLLNARDQGFEPLGLELTRKAVRYANDRLGIPVVSTQFLDTPYEENSLAAVTMIHVLEHLPQPKQAIEKVARILQPGGWFCGIVPNIASFCSQHQGEDWFWLDPNYHYVHFSPATLRRHLEAAGFVVERLYTTRGDYNKDRLRQAAQAFAPELADDAAFERWLAQIEAEGRGEEIRFFARKPGKPAATAPAVPTVGLLSGQVRRQVDELTPAEPPPVALADARACPPSEVLPATPPSAALPSVSVVIPVFNQVGFTRRCLQTLHRHAPAGCPLEVIVVDNASTDGTAAFLEEAAREYPTLRVLRQTENLGFARACNLGAASARGQYLVFLNNDTEPQPGWLEAALQRLEQDTAIGVLGVKLLYPDRRVQHCGIEFFRWVNPDYELWPLHRYRRFSEHDPMVNRPGEVSAVTGACLFIRRDLFQQVRGFSTEYPMYFEDTDLCFKVRQQGRTVFYEPRSVVIHHEGQSSPNRERIDQLNREAAPIFFRKWERAVRLEADTARLDGRYVYLRQEVLPLWAEREMTTERLTQIAQSLAKFLEEIGPFYMHFGGAGDALLLLATFLDRDPTAQVVSFPNSIPAARSLFDAFPSLRRVYFLPPNPSPQIHLLLRMMMRHVPTFRGMGVTPECDYGKEWFEGIDIFKKYGVTRRPAWIRTFLPGPAKAGTESGPHCSNQPALPPSPLSPEAAASTPAAGRVVLAPKGSLIGMVGSKRNCIDPQLWPQLLEFVRERGFLPVVIGTPDERTLYPAPEGCEDRRSYSFKEQMELIASSQVFIGADSWGKTFAALAGLPTIVFDPLKGADWRGKKDPADFVFIDPWDTIAKVHSLEECRDAFTRFTQGVPPEVVGRQWRKRRTARPTPLGGVRLAWEGSFLDYGSLSHVNRALTDALEAQPGLKLVRRQTTPPAAALPAPLRAYAHRLTRSGVSVSPARSNSAKGPTRGKHPSTESDAWPTVTVRHAWPPDWSPVSQGPLVVIQPWEYGALPEDWVHQAGHVTQFWVPSEYVRRVYVASGVPAEKVKVVPNGFDPQRFHPGVAPMPLATRKRFKFLFVGGTIPRKGADLLLQTYLDEFTAQDDVCLVVKDFGGQSVYAGQTLEAQIRAAQSRPGAPEILYLNEELPPEALPSLYTACDCLVHPYRGEGFGLPVLEAMACGLPVIVTAGGATDDFATPDVVYPVPAQPRALGRVLSGMKLAATGWWLEPIAITLAAQMRHVVEHPTEARAKGRAAAERARRQWTWEHAAQQARRHLEDLLAAEGLNLRDPAAPELAGERRSTEAPKAAASHPPARNGTPTGHPASAGTPPPRQAAPLQLPPCALLGHLGEARELLRRKKLREAWEATRAAIAVRPFHPEAYLLLAEIAAAAGDSVSARRCAQHARDLAPGFRPAKQFLQSHPRGRTRPEWLHLPEALGAVDTPAPKPSTAGNHACHASRHAPHAPRLTVCLITKNEEQFLGQCLQSVRELADQIVVMDTGSTDWTPTIAARFGAEVYSCEWQDDFSAARNAALEHARGDWILFLDADEELLPESRNALLKEIRDPSAIAYRLPIVDKGREDEGRSFVPRLFRNAPGLFYVGRVHEQIFSSLEVRRRQWGLENKLGTATLRHHGYTTEIVRDRQKIERNLRLLQRAIEELPGEPNLLMNLGLELARSGQAEAALARYWEAFDAMAALPRDQVVPELREALLTQLSTRLIAAKRFEDVVQLLRSPLARAGGLTASLHFALGLALLELKQFAPAAEQMRECLAKRRRPTLTPINKEILGAGPQHCLALCLSALQRPAEAEQAFRAALQDDPRSRAARWDFANFLREQDRPLDALKVLNELIALQPDDPAAWRAGGQIALSRSEFLEFARDWTGEAVKFCPQDPVVLNQRAEALTLSEAVTEALPLWRQLRAQQRLAQRAPLVICELLANELGEPFEADDERAVSREFIQWYQRLVQAGAHSVVLSLNGRVEALRRRLPSAAHLLDAALSEAKTSELN